MGKAWDDYDHFPGGLLRLVRGVGHRMPPVLKPGVPPARVRRHPAHGTGSRAPSRTRGSRCATRSRGCTGQGSPVARRVQGHRQGGGRRAGGRGPHPTDIRRSHPAAGGVAGATHGGESGGCNFSDVRNITAPRHPDAERWQGWGTALKPSHEPVCRAVKPHSTSDMMAEIGSHLARLEDECRQHASDAARSSAPTWPADRPSEDRSLPLLELQQPSLRPSPRAQPNWWRRGSSAQTAARVRSMGATCWSTVTPWKACWPSLRTDEHVHHLPRPGSTTDLRT